MPGQVMLRALCCNVHVAGLAQHASTSPEAHAASGAVVQLPVNLDEGVLARQHASHFDTTECMVFCKLTCT